MQQEMLLSLIDHVKHGLQFNYGDPKDKIIDVLELSSILITNEYENKEHAKEAKDKYPEEDFLDDVIDDLDDLIKSSSKIKKEDIITTLSTLMTKLKNLQTKVISDTNVGQEELDAIIYPNDR